MYGLKIGKFLSSFKNEQTAYIVAKETFLPVRIFSESSI